MLYLIILLGVLGGLTYSYFAGEQHGNEARGKKDEVIMAQLRQDKSDVLAANKRFESDLGKLKTETAACNTTVDLLSKQSADALNDNTKAIAASDARRKAFESRIEQRLREAQAPASSTRTEQQKCETAKATLNDLSDAMRDNAGTTPAPVPAPRTPPPSPAAATGPRPALPSAVKKP